LLALILVSLGSTNNFAGKISTLARDYSLALVFPVEFRFKEYKKLSCFASLTFFVFNTLSKASFWRA
jgi:hypothetical protein